MLLPRVLDAHRASASLPRPFTVTTTPALAREALRREEAGGVPRPRECVFWINTELTASSRLPSNEIRHGLHGWSEIPHH
jgi:hypothetical protein